MAGMEFQAHMLLGLLVLGAQAFALLVGASLLVLLGKRHERRNRR